MTDNLTKDQRRRNMQAIKSRDTSIEIMLRKTLWKSGIRYRKNLSSVPGKPDIAITKYKIAVFCDSDFWHGFEWETNKHKIKTNHDYWIPKIERNMQRDEEINTLLRNADWTVIRFWEHEIRKSLQDCANIVLKVYNELSKQ